MKKTMLLFGGSSDVGKAIIRDLSKDYEIYATGNRNPVEGSVKKSFRCDIRRQKDVDSVLDAVPQADAVVFSAFPEVLNDAKDFGGYLEAEPLLRGYMYTMTESISKKLVRGGKIVSILGQCVNHGLVGAPWMGMAFAAMHNYSNSVNAKYGRRGEFAIYDLLMGPIDTKMWDRVPGQYTEENRRNSAGFVKPEVVASYVRQILAHDIGPTEIVIDGFYSLPSDV